MFADEFENGEWLLSTNSALTVFAGNRPIGCPEAKRRANVGVRQIGSVGGERKERKRELKILVKTGFQW